MNTIALTLESVDVSRESQLTRLRRKVQTSVNVPYWVYL